jgi:hypothetical protein
VQKGRNRTHILSLYAQFPPHLENITFVKHQLSTEQLSNSTIAWAYEDFMSNTTARVALKTPHESAVTMAVSGRLNDLSASRRKETMEKYSENIKQPCKWVRKPIDPSVPWNKQTRSWGFVSFRQRFLRLFSSWWMITCVPVWCT